MQVAIACSTTCSTSPLWPLPQQQRRKRWHKRRVGLGFTGLGDALSCWACATTRDEARAMAAKIARAHARRCLCRLGRLAEEKGAFPLFDADTSWRRRISPRACRDALQAADPQARHAQLHLLSIAPTGTISLAFADNASNGIEPPFSWTYTRKKRMADGTQKEYDVEDHAWRLYQRLRRRRWSSCRRTSSRRWRSPRCDHMRMVAAVAAFRGHHHLQDGERARGLSVRGLQGPVPGRLEGRAKGLATYRPNKVLGSVLAVRRSRRPRAAGSRHDDTDRRIRIESRAAAGAREPALAGTPGAGPRATPRGPTWSSPRTAEFAVFVGHVENGAAACLRSLGERQRAAARPGRGSQDAVDGHARARTRPGCKLKLDTLPRRATSMPSTCRAAGRRDEAACPAWWRRSRSIVRWRCRAAAASSRPTTSSAIAGARRDVRA